MANNANIAVVINNISMVMKKLIFSILFASLLHPALAFSEENSLKEQKKQEIQAIRDKYKQQRESKQSERLAKREEFKGNREVLKAEFKAKKMP